MSIREDFLVVENDTCFLKNFQSKEKPLCCAALSQLGYVHRRAFFSCEKGALEQRTRGMLVKVCVNAVGVIVDKFTTVYENKPLETVDEDLR